MKTLEKRVSYYNMWETIKEFSLLGHVHEKEKGSASILCKVGSTMTDNDQMERRKVLRVYSMTKRGFGL